MHCAIQPPPAPLSVPLHCLPLPPHTPAPRSAQFEEGKSIFLPICQGCAFDGRSKDIGGRNSLFLRLFSHPAPVPLRRLFCFSFRADERQRRGARAGESLPPSTRSFSLSPRPPPQMRLSKHNAFNKTDAPLPPLPESEGAFAARSSPRPRKENFIVQRGIVGNQGTGPGNVFNKRRYFQCVGFQQAPQGWRQGRSSGNDVNNLLYGSN